MNSAMYYRLEESTAGVKSRTSVSNFAMKNEENLAELIAIAFNLSHEHHIKAFWNLEKVCEKKLKLFVPYIDTFCEVLPKLKEDSAIRPATKISMFLAKSNHRKNGINLLKEQEHIIIEALVDRLIQEEKVAAKVYAMKALFVLGKKYDWIYEELKPIISQDYSNHSAAYKAAARNILKRLN